MAGLGMAILGGALEQVGTGIADRGKALREAKLKEIEQEREFQFRSSQAALGDERQAAENQKSRDAQAAEGAKNRDAQKTTYATDAEGNQVMVRGAEATPVTMGGKPLKAATKAGDKPADQQMVEYLMSIGKTQEQALNWVKSSRSKSEEESKLSLYKSILTANGDGDSEKAQAETDKIWAKYGNPDSGGDSQPAAEGPGNVIPSDPGKRVVGKVYKAPNGKIAKWTGQGWQPL